jgi:hypothetical protein
MAVSAIADRMALRFIGEEDFGTTPVAELLAKTTVEAVEVATGDLYRDEAEDLTVFKDNQTILVSGFTTAANNGYKRVVSSTNPTGTYAAATINAETADDSYNDAIVDLSNFVAGQYILVAGFTEAGNNGIKTIVSATANKIVVAENLTDEVLGDAVTIASFSTLVVREDLTNEIKGDSVSIKSAMMGVRFVSETLKQETSVAESAEIRNDRQIADVKRTSVSASGDVGVEMSYAAYDELLEAALMSAAWSAEAEDSGITFSMASGDNSINDSDNNFVAAGFLANQWIEVRGFTTAANNGYFKIVSVAVGKMVLTGGTVSTEAAGDSVTVTMGPQIVNGTTKRSFTFEKEYTDLTNVFAAFTGMMVDRLGMDISAESIITATFGLVGKDGASKTATLCTGTAQTPDAYDVMAAVDEVYAVLENFVSVDVVALTLELTNNLRAMMQVGDVGPVDEGAGKVNVSGTVQMYFQTATIMNKYLDQTASALAFILEDGDGNAYVIDMPQVRYTSGERTAGGENTDIIANMGFSAYRDETEGVTIRIAKFDA